MTTAIADIAQLSVAERIQLAEDIWDTIVASPEQLTLSEAQRQELERRLEDLDKNSASGSPWPEVRQRIQGRK